MRRRYASRYADVYCSDYLKEAGRIRFSGHAASILFTLSGKIP
jgi:hypothetical protein